MANAITKVPHLRHAKWNWDLFDRLPRHIKEAIWNAPTCIILRKAVSPAMLEVLMENYYNCISEKTLQTYGPDHPGAKRHLEATLRAKKAKQTTRQSASDLGF